MTGSLAYDPAAIERLRRETAWAAGALRGLQMNDPAADAAQSAIVGLRRVLEDQWMPAIITVQRHDPLSGGLVAPTLDALRPPTESTVPALLTWAHQHVADQHVADLAALTDAELLDAFALSADELPHDTEHLPDIDDPFWIEFEVLAAELARRVASHPELADEMIDRVTSNPLLAIAVGFAPFPTEVVQAMAIEALQLTSHIDDVESRYDALATETLLRDLLPHPDLVLGVVTDFAALRELIHWPFIDADLAAEFVRVGMLHPVDEPDRLGDGLRLLEHFVTLANERRFEQGFPPPFAEIMATGVTTYLPTYVESLETGDSVALRPPHRVTSEEFIDLLGALLYDPEAAAVLVGAVRSMAVLAMLPGTSFDLADVGDYALKIVRGAENERLEAEMRAASSRALIEGATVVIGLATASITAAKGLSATTRALIGRIVNGAGAGIGERVRAADTGIDDPSATLEALFELALCETFLADPEHHNDQKSPVNQATVRAARASLERIGELLAGNASWNTIDDELRNLQSLVKSTGGKTLLSALDAGSIRALDRDESEVDT